MRRMIYRTVTAVSACCFAFCRGYADDSAWLTQQIANAINAGQSEYVIPAGDYVLDNPIVIPPGTSNFTIRGAGASQTVLRTPNKQISHAFRVGVIPIIWNNWGIANQPNFNVSPVRTGAQKVQLLPDQNPLQPGYYVLWDNYNIKCAKNVWNNLNHAEVVQVLSYNPNTRIATLDVPVGREYSVTPKLAFMGGQVCKNLTISDMGFNGACGSSASNGIVGAGITDGLKLKNLEVSNFFTEAIMTTTCRNVEIEGCKIDGAIAGDPGNGYGFTIYRSRFVTIKNCRSDQNMRHGLILHSGTLDVSISDCQMDAGFDLHGYDERRVQFNRCVGSINIGNDAWLGGAKDVLVSSCEVPEIEFHPNVSQVSVTNSKIGGVRLFNTVPGTTAYPAEPAGGFPDAILFSKCDIASNTSYTVLWDCGKAGTLTFVNCKIENTRNDWGNAIRLDNLGATINLVKCNIINKTGYVPINILSKASNLYINMQNCTVQTKSSTAMWIDRNFRGRVSLRRNTLYSPNASKFVNDQSGRARSINNSAIKAVQ